MPRGRRRLRPDEVSARQYEAYPPQPVCQVRLSNEAFAHLRSRAELYGYVKPDSDRAIGLSQYLQSLTDPRQQWVDTRPLDLITLSERLLDSTRDSTRRTQASRNPRYLFDPEAPPPRRGRAPGLQFAVWWDPDLQYVRTNRTFKQVSFPLTYYANLALTFGITDPHHREFQFAPHLRASNALEAIGLQSLTPRYEYHNPNPPRSPKVRRHTTKEDIVW